MKRTNVRLGVFFSPLDVRRKAPAASERRGEKRESGEKSGNNEKSVDSEKRFYNNVANRVDANRAIFRERQIAFPAPGKFPRQQLRAFIKISIGFLWPFDEFVSLVRCVYFFQIHYSFALFFRRGQKRSFLRARHAFRVRKRL